MFWALKMIAQMEFVTKGDFETVALDFRIILWVFSIFQKMQMYFRFWVEENSSSWEKKEPTTKEEKKL